MYIAIEGIKGAGKSTIFKALKNDTFSSSNEISFFPITAPMPAWHPIEKLYQTYPFCKENDAFIEYLFLQRALYHNPETKNTLVVGDRSVATSIVTRWHKWKDPLYTIKKVRREYRQIMKPDVIIYIDTPVSISIQNISQRVRKKTGFQQENTAELCKASEVYHELFFDKTYQHHLGRTEIIKIPYSSCLWEIQNEIYSIIKFYKK
jgi:thymidylate kinase